MLYIYTRIGPPYGRKVKFGQQSGEPASIKNKIGSLSVTGVSDFR